MTSSISNIGRREFLTWLKGALGALGAAALLGPVLAYFWPANLEETPSEPVPVGPPDDLPEGTAKTIRFGRYPALIIHTPSGIKAYSAVCTHFACIVSWDAETGVIACPCHEGYFHAEDGSVISGPPPTPLEAIPTFVEDGVLFIGGGA